MSELSSAKYYSELSEHRREQELSEEDTAFERFMSDDEKRAEDFWQRAEQEGLGFIERFVERFSPQPKE